ncbi:MAG TPA: hypothetical protein VKU02_04365 [Gemmataceae bacterium]|nr:hypothetical protein [Gemmataceae bacterium]
MAMKDFNFKQFMLQKGEWVGLGVALILALPVFGIGMMKILGSPKPSSTAMRLENLVKAADQKIQSAKPPEDADKPPKEFFTNIVYGRVDPDEYSTPTDWFIGSSIEDTRRRSPEVLPPGDFIVNVVRGGMKGYILDRAGKRVMGLQQKSVVLGQERKSKKLFKLSDRLSGAGRYTPPGYTQTPGMPGGERGGPGMGAPGMAPAGGTGGITTTTWVDIDKVGTSQNVRLAEQVYPVRMAVVTGTFPFRQQMDEFRRALKKRTLDELFAMFNAEEASWKFLNFRIQRRVFYQDGRQKADWQDYDETLNSAFATLFAEAVDYEKEDADLHKYEGILNKGLVMVRPQLERGEYPKVEIQSIKDTLAKLDKESQGEEVKRPLSDLARKLRRQGVDVWDVFNPLLPEEEEEAGKAMLEKPTPSPTDNPEKKKDTDADSELLIPDKALIRFMDVTVEPGLVYEYRIKVKMGNPNYKQKNLAYASLGTTPQIEASDWTVVPKVEVPRDIYYYAIDEKPARDNTIIQVHRWVESLFKDPQNEQTQTYVGDWSIAEKLPVRRGEYLGRFAETKVPLWNIEKEDWELGFNPKNRRDQNLPVDFTVRTSRALDPALLVDYRGGKDHREPIEYRTPDSNKPKINVATDSVPVQLLVLTPEGKLIVHNQPDDNSNEERIARHKAWKDWIAEVQSGRRKPKTDESPFNQFRGGGSSN